MELFLRRQVLLTRLGDGLAVLGGFSFQLGLFAKEPLFELTGALCGFLFAALTTGFLDGAAIGGGLNVLIAFCDRIWACGRRQRRRDGCLIAGGFFAGREEDHGCHQESEQDHAAFEHESLGSGPFGISDAATDPVR